MIQIYSDNLNSQPTYYLQASGQQTYPKNEIALKFPYILKVSHTFTYKDIKMILHIHKNLCRSPMMIMNSL